MTDIDLDFYDGHDTPNQRILEWMAECNAAGVEFRKAAIVAAIASNESNEMFRMARVAVLPFPTDCFPARPPLVVEDGNPQFGTVLPASWTQDPDIMQMMRTRGYLNQSGTQWLSSLMGVDLPTAANNFRTNENIAFMFEWLMDQRKLAALAAYSIGPTQVFMRFSPITGGSSSKIASRFATFEKLFQFYFATDAKAMFDSGAFDYLPINISSYPIPGRTTSGGGNASVGTSSAIETYLTNNQTGTRDWDDPTWKAYAARVLNAVGVAWQMGKNVGPWQADKFNDMG